MKAPTPITDQTAYLQSFIDNNLVIPPGYYRFFGQLRVDAGKSLVGSGPVRTVLQYFGPASDDGAISIPAGSWAYSLRGFSLNEPSQSMTGCGIRGGATNTGQFGTQSGFARIDDVWVDGFQYGLRFGDRSLNTSCSEITATNLRISTCDVGWRIETQNSLDYTLIQLGLAGCRVGLETDGAGCVHILGGSVSGVKESVWSITGSGTFSIRNLRTENSGPLVVNGFTLARTAILIDSCETNGPARRDIPDVKICGGAVLTMRGGTYAGHVAYEGFPTEPNAGYGSINLDGVGFGDTVMITSPGRTNCQYSIRDCVLLDTNNQTQVRVDESGTIGSTPRIPH
jgi:hypothetical protein